MASILESHKVRIVASLACYARDNVDAQRGKGVFEKSITALKKLNTLGYGEALELNLVYNPQGTQVPPDQSALEADYKDHLFEHFGIVFTRLFTITNMTIKRCGSWLISTGQFDENKNVRSEERRVGKCKEIWARQKIKIKKKEKKTNKSKHRHVKQKY